MKLKFIVLIFIMSFLKGYSQDLKKCRAIISLIEQSISEGSDEKIESYLASDFSIANQSGPFARAILKQMLPKLKNSIISSKELSVSKDKDIVTFIYLNTFKRGQTDEASYSFNKENEIVYINIFNLKTTNSASNNDTQLEKNTSKVETKITNIQNVEFEASDGLKVNGNLYEVDSKSPVILLCHMANRNKSEYNEIAKEFNRLGYTCLAIDQRSGGSNLGGINETNIRAKSKKLGTEYLDAKPDIQAAIDYLYNTYNTKVILLGSSYSSGLALFEALENDKLKAVISMSPNDYYGDSVPSLGSVIPKINIPYFITASKQEAKNIKHFFNDIELSSTKVFFEPEVNGMHGSMSLLKSTQSNDSYWKAIQIFLSKI